MSKLIESVEPRIHSFFEEFKNFAFKGNVIDLAVGVVIGTAFGKVVDSLVKNILNPLISMVLPVKKGDLGWTVEIYGQKLLFGMFIGEILNFIIVSFAVFIFIVKFFGWLTRVRGEKEAARTPALSKDQELLTEIRDLLKQQHAPGIKD